VIVLAALAAPAGAQLSEPYASWADGPEGLLLTPEERTELAALTTDSEVAAFIQLFWARRDPDLDTPVNETRLDLQARVKAADEQFTEEGLRGSLSDQGKALILLGMPVERQVATIDEYLDVLYKERLPIDGVKRNRIISTESDLQYRFRGSRGMPPSGIENIDPDSKDRQEGKVSDEGLKHGVRYSIAAGQAEIWVYPKEQIAALAGLGDLPKDGVPLPFFDHKGTGQYRLETMIRGGELAARVLAAAPAAFLVHPELTAVPLFPLLAGLPAAGSQHLQWLDQEPAPWPDGAQAQLVHGVRTADELLAWLVLSLPPEVPVADTLAGRMLRADGTVAGSFQVPVSALESSRGRVYELMLPAPAQGATFQLAVAAGSQLLAVHSLALEAAEIEPDGTFITPVVAGAVVEQRQSYDPGAPFIFGGFHLTVRPDGRFSADENLTYFCLLVRPGLEDSGQPKVWVAMKVYRGDEPQALFSTPRREAPVSPVAPDVYMFGSQLPLSSMPEPGAYRFKLTVTDAVTDVKRTTEIPFVVE
jgi:GWxTD domain-containing protein